MKKYFNKKINCNKNKKRENENLYKHNLLKKFNTRG